MIPNNVTKALTPNQAKYWVLSHLMLEIDKLPLFFICSLFFHLLLRADTTFQVDCRLGRYCSILMFCFGKQSSQSTWLLWSRDIPTCRETLNLSLHTYSRNSIVLWFIKCDILNYQEILKKEKLYPNSAFLFQKLEINTFQGVESNKQWLPWLH